jgi:anthranilate synthase component 1
MSGTLRLGEARALSRRLAVVPDRLDLYAALSDCGRCTDTMLLETLAGPGMILEKAAVRIECRGRDVTIEALSANGENLLEFAAAALSGRVAQRSRSTLELRFDRPSGDEAQARLLASSPFDALRTLTAGMRSLTPEEPFTLCAPGIVAFDHVDLFEDLPAAAHDPLGFPDFLFWIAETLILFEPGGAPRILSTAFGSEDPDRSQRAHFEAIERLGALAKACGEASNLRSSPAKSRSAGIDSSDAPLDYARDERVAESARSQIEVDLDDGAYAAVVSDMKAHILAGDVYQIVPSRTFSAPCPDPLAAFAAARRLDPSPYMFFVSGPEHILFGASPETSVRVGAGIVEVKPIAGTRRRGATPDEDDRMEADLRLDGKEVAEHMMLVDLARNDVARVSEPGTRRVAGLMSVERYARVMHLVSSVQGRLARGLDAFHALQACLNVGTLSGAPKLKATQLLRQAEATKRGPYGGAVGWVNGAGALDSGVVIRSAVVKDGTAFVRAGAGVVYDSDPAKEADETRRKASAILSAIAASQPERREAAE